MENGRSNAAPEGVCGGEKNQLFLAGLPAMTSKSYDTPGKMPPRSDDMDAHPKKSVELPIKRMVTWISFFIRPQYCVL